MLVALIGEREEGGRVHKLASAPYNLILARNSRDKAKGLCISSERYIGELGVRCLSTLNRGQDSKQQYLS